MSEPTVDPAAQAAAASQIAAQSELDPTAAAAPAAASQEDLGIQAAAAGAQADAVDPRELLASIKALQSQVDQLNAEKASANVPDVVKYTTAIADHLQARADQNPTLHANADQTWMPALETAASVVNDATAAAKSGDVSTVLAGLEKLRAFFTSHGKANPAQDYGYLHQLADEAQSAAEKAAA